MFRKILITLVSAAALSGAGAVPALAVSPPSTSGSVGFSAQVVAAETISLTGLSGFGFPTTPAGDTASATDAENYTVATIGVGTGYTLEISTTASAMAGYGDAGGASILNTHVTIVETDASAGQFTLPSGGTYEIGSTTTTPSSNTYSENWQLGHPGWPDARQLRRVGELHRDCEQLMSTSPFSLTASPTVVRAAPGQDAAVKVFDTGTAPLGVNVSVAPVAKTNGKCTEAASPAREVRLASPAHIELQPGGHATAVVHIGRTAPRQDLAIIFSGDPGKTGGNIAVSGAVGVQVLVDGEHGVKTGGCVAAAKPHQNPQQSPGSVLAGAGSPGASTLIILACAVAALALWILGLRLFRRRRRRQAV